MDATFNVILPMIFGKKNEMEKKSKNKKIAKCQICNLTFDAEKLK